LKPSVITELKSFLASLFRNIISILMEYDANILLKDSQGKTAYDHACNNRKVTVNNDTAHVWVVNTYVVWITGAGPAERAGQV
jgi:hypothetical protein